MITLSIILATYLAIAFGMLYGAHDALAVKYRRATQNVEPLKKNSRVALRVSFCFFVAVMHHLLIAVSYEVDGFLLLATVFGMSFLTLHIAFVLAYNVYENNKWYHIGTTSVWDRFLGKLPFKDAGKYAIYIGILIYLALIFILYIRLC